MITVRTSPAYVNRVRQDWTANGGVYGDGGVYALVPSNDPFAQLGPTLDLTFAGNPTDLLTASTTAGYTLDTYFTPETYQIAVPYAIWEDGVGLAQKTFAQIVTFTRASTATYFNSAGTLTSAAVDEARFDYDPSTLAPLGFLIEESRTNSIRNNTMVGAVAGTPGTLPTNWTTPGLGTLTQEVVGSGVINGIEYIDLRYSGTTSNTSFREDFDSPTQISAADGQTWTNSFWVALVGGSTTNITSIASRITENTSVGGFVAGGSGSNLVSSLSSTLTRVSQTRTLSGGGTVARVSPGILFSYSSGVAIDITLRIGLPQLEQGAFATSVIPTTTTALTRSADVASVNTLSPWYNASAGTLYAESAAIAFTARPATFNDGTANNAIGLVQTAISTGQNTYVSNVFQGTAGVAGTYTTNTVYKQASAYKLNDAQDAANGTTNTTDTTLSVPAVTQLLIGQGRAGASAISNSWIRRLTYYPRRLSQAELAAITT